MNKREKMTESIYFMSLKLTEVLKIKKVAQNCICRIQQISALPEQAKISFFFIFNRHNRRSTPCYHKDC
jgi:hypothetical protein